MIRFAELISRYGKRRILVAAVIFLLGVNVLRFGINFYAGQKEELAQNIQLLEKYRKSTGKIEMLRKRVKRLEQQSRDMAAFLFTGGSEEEISSAMQIILQDQVVKAGLEPESLRSKKAVNTVRGKDFGEISINLRLAGSLKGFVKFLSNLYKSKQLFKIESFTLKPYKKTELKIFMELKGFYKLNKEK